MKNLSPFCTCRDTQCPMHPTNHEQGCAPCISKNLREREIPSCFFNKTGSAADHSVFSFEEFAKSVIGR